MCADSPPLSAETKLHPLYGQLTQGLVRLQGRSLVVAPVRFHFWLRVGHVHLPVLVSAAAGRPRCGWLLAWIRSSLSSRCGFQLQSQLGQLTASCPDLAKWPDVGQVVGVAGRSRQGWRCSDVNERCHRRYHRRPPCSPPLEVHGRFPSPCCAGHVPRQGGIVEEEWLAGLLEAGSVRMDMAELAAHGRLANEPVSQ